MENEFSSFQPKAWRGTLSSKTSRQPSASCRVWPLQPTRRITTRTGATCTWAHLRQLPLELVTSPLRYKQVKVELWTHDAPGLTEKDFHLAAVMDSAAAATGDLGLGSCG